MLELTFSNLVFSKTNQPFTLKQVLLEIPPILFENLSHLSLRLEKDDAHYVIPFLEKLGDINSLCIEESHVAAYHEEWGISSNNSENGYHQFQVELQNTLTHSLSHTHTHTHTHARTHKCYLFYISIDVSFFLCISG